MNVLIKIHYIYNTIDCLQKGEFRVNYRDYKKDPDKTVAERAAKWIKEIMMNFPEMKVTKVLYNEDIQITEEVKALL